MPKTDFVPFGDFKLWTTGPRTEAIITAHGRLPFFNKLLAKKQVPAGMTLVFYCPKGTALLSGSISHHFIDNNLGNSPYKEKPPGSNYSDIVLTRYRHEDQTSAQKLADVERCLPRYDVITIRNGPWYSTGEVALSDLLEQLRSQGRLYTRVHCSFCRSYPDPISETLWGKPTYDMEENLNIFEKRSSGEDVTT